MTACVARLILATPQNSATVDAVESASNQNGASSPILRPLAGSITASEPKDNQIATPATNAVRMVGTDARRTAAAYVKRTRQVSQKSFNIQTLLMMVACVSARCRPSGDGMPDVESGTFWCHTTLT